jgi:hypothetical protein
LTKPPLAFEDAFELLGPALPGGAIVLVGGQALIHWLTYYRDRVEALRQISFVTSDDVDFYGTQEDARRMAEALAGSDVRNFGVDSLSAATAIVRFRDQAGEERQIDFLRTVHGLDSEQVRNTAIEVELKDRAGNPTGVSLRILHPVLCLVSRFHNTHGFPKYQEARGLRQARAAIGIARGYLQDQVDAGHIRIAHNAIKIVADLASSPGGRAVYEQFQLDALDAIPNDARLGDAFFAEQLPRIRARAGR